jgi:membrane-associated protease RseP (regulator of RpoE activity)
MYWIISLFLLMLVHEGSHAVMAAREKVRIKTLGWGVLAVIPMAFVEPDEDQLQKQKPMKQLRVFAAGSMGNFVLAFIMIYVMAFSIPAFYEVSDGVSFSGYLDGYPAQDANLTGTIVSIDGYRIDTVQNLSYALDQIGPGKRITVTTELEGSDGIDIQSFSLVTEENPDGGDGGFIGITGLYTNIEIKEGVNRDLTLFFFGQNPFGSDIRFYGLFFWIYLLNLAIGMINLVPALPTDGGRMWKILFDKITPKHSMMIIKILTIAFWFTLISLIAFDVITGTTLF